MSNKTDQWESRCLADAVHVCQGACNRGWGGGGGRRQAKLKAFQFLPWQLFQL